MIQKPGDRHWGYQLQRATKVRGGRLYPTLWRWHSEGLLSDGWEDKGEAERSGRPARRYYQLTDKGREVLTQALNQ